MSSRNSSRTFMLHTSSDLEAPIKVLLVTNSEHGQANIFLGLAYELLHRDNIEVHLCSYAPLQPRFKDLINKYAHSFPAGYASRAHFHTMRGLSMIEVSARGGSGGPMPHKPTVAGCVDFFKALDGDVWGWTKEEFLDGYESGKEVIDAVKPDITVIDQYFIQARDAAVNMAVKYCLVETMSLSRVIGKLQKHQAWLWKYPAPGSSFEYPVPGAKIAKNIFVQLRIAYDYLTSPQRKKVLGWRKKAGIKGPFAWEDEWKIDRLTLTPSLPLLDWPMEIPDNVVGCGPITLPTDLTHVTQSDICQWLKQGPTVLINLGSLYTTTADKAAKLAFAVKIFLSQPSRHGVQVLWKLGNYRSETQQLLDISRAILQDLCDAGRVRIVQWLDVDPVALLSTGHIVCTVHHGGANSWFEGLRYSVPQVLLPAWFDCYDNAKRTEWLGVGVWANQSCAPDISSSELIICLNAIFENDKYRTKAEEVAEKLGCTEGRTIAVGRILQAASPNSVTWGRAPGELPEIEHIDNGKGETLMRAKPEREDHGRIYRAFQTLCIALHFTFHLWALPVFCILLGAPLELKLFEVFCRDIAGHNFQLGTIPWSFFTICWALWITYTAYTVWDTGATENHITPWRYRLAQKTPMWKAYCKARYNYYPISLWTPAALPLDKSYIIGNHPHGTGSTGVNLFEHDKVLPGTKLFFMANSVMFKLPIFTDIAQMMNAKSVSKSGIRALLTTGGVNGKGGGNLVSIMIGGGREASWARPNSMDVVCRCRKGFVRLAIETGASIVPVMTFGENELMDVVDGNAGWVTWAIKKVFTLLYKTDNHKDIKLYQGRFGVPFIAPHRKPINVVLGHPIEVEKQIDVVEEYVTEIHERYMRGLEQVWDDWRDKFGVNSSVDFRIVE